MAKAAFGVLTLPLPLSLLQGVVHDHFDNGQKAKSLPPSLPVCIIHGDRDEIVPYAMGRTLHELIPHSEFHTLRDTGHNDVFERAEAVVELITTFAKGKTKAP